MPKVFTVDIKNEAITGPKLSSTVAIPAGATCATAGQGDNDDSLASTAFVQQEITANATYFSDSFTGTGTALDPIDLDQSLFSVTAGTYTPTLSNTTNVTSSTPTICHYFKIGNQVTINGSVTLTSTAGGSADTVLGISLPIASDFAATTDGAGLGNPVSVGSFLTNVYMEANATTNVIEIKALSISANTGQVFFNVTYTVI